MNIKEKLEFVRIYRGPITIGCIGWREWTFVFFGVGGNPRRLIDNDFDSLVERAYVITEGEVRSWGEMTLGGK